MLESFAAFFATAALLAATPGPDLLFTIAQSALQGARAGITFVGGLCSGLLVHSAAVAGGVGTMIAALPGALRVLQLGGCAYLGWLALQLWRAPTEPLEAANGAPTAQSAVLSASQLYRRGLWMNLTNPKVLVFFLALLPQFVVAEGPPAPAQMLALGGLFVVATLLVFGAAAAVAGKAGSALGRSGRSRRTVSRLAAAMLTLVALRMLMLGLNPPAVAGATAPVDKAPVARAPVATAPATTTSPTLEKAAQSSRQRCDETLACAEGEAGG